MTGDEMGEAIRETRRRIVNTDDPPPAPGDSEAVRRPTTRRIPPHNLNAEESTLGALLLGSIVHVTDDDDEVVVTDPWQQVTGKGLQPRHFYRPSHGYIFEAVAAVHAAGDVRIDVTVVGEQLRKMGLLEQVGGIDYLHRLQNNTPTISNAGRYAATVVDLAMLRDLIPVVADLNDAIYSENWAAVSEAGAKLDGGGRLSTTLSGWEWIDWSNVGGDDNEVVDGLVYAGRWLSMNAAAKAGKTTLIVSVGIQLSEGRHPFDATSLHSGPLRVVHLDAEVGRVELGDVVRNCGYDPSALTCWWATDLPGHLSTVDGADAALRRIREVDAQVVIVDGVNGTIIGAEKDDTPWRDLFDLFVRPVKADGRALLTTDNTGHDAKSRPRGSSVKLDKPDAVAMLTRSDDGLTITMPWRRSSVYQERIELAATGFDGSTAVRYRRTGAAWPAGTRAVADLLDELGVPLNAGRTAARDALREAREGAVPADVDRFQVRTEVLAAAIRFRKSRIVPP